jgi:hypothetical protein
MNEVSKLIPLGPAPVSLKDLKAGVIELLKTLKKKDLEETIVHFQTLRDKNLYIPYYSNVSGLSHHSNLGPSRAPKKVYQYIIDQLKGLRGAISYLLKNHKEIIYDQIIINASSYKRSKGVRRCSKGRAYKEDGRLFRALIRIKFEK